jgi:hypothetical protein
MDLGIRTTLRRPTLLRCCGLGTFRRLQTFATIVSSQTTVRFQRAIPAAVAVRNLSVATVLAKRARTAAIAKPIAEAVEVVAGAATVPAMMARTNGIAPLTAKEIRARTVANAAVNL